jgi:hypothetical protein
MVPVGAKWIKTKVRLLGMPAGATKGMRDMHDAAGPLPESHPPQNSVTDENSAVYRDNSLTVCDAPGCCMSGLEVSMRAGKWLAAIACAVTVVTAAGAHAIVLEQINPPVSGQRSAAAAILSTQLAASGPRKTARYRTETVAQLQTARRTSSGGAQIFLLKGFADVFSSGMDALAEKLRRRGIAARVASHSSSDTLADEVASRYKAGARGPVIIVGHSLGADAAATMARRLNDSKIPVALVIAYGPTASQEITPNVARAINYFQTSGSWRGQFRPAPGFHGSLVNINLDNAADINHFNIDKIDRLHSQSISQIMAVVGGARRSSASAHKPTGASGNASATGETGSPAALSREN